MSRGRILVVDADHDVRSRLRTQLRAEGYDAVSAPDPIKALCRASELAPEVVLTEVRMPTGSGLSFMEQVRELRPECVFLVMTASATVEGAVEAIKRGADDYLEKPLAASALLAAVERAMHKAKLLGRTRPPRDGTGSDALARILGDHPSIRGVRERIGRVAPTSVTVLVSGETGTGKELVASALHARSGRAGAPLVKLSCAVLAESVLESELFGHERGAFTGALARREGRFEQADGGTLYLDEVSEIPPSTQVKLLRVLQEQEFERVGGNETLRVDVRLVASTNEDLRRAVDAGRFREDLFYRLDVVRIEMPPLRARRTDVPLLAAAFRERFAERHGKPVDALSAEALELLEAYTWPGNVRELENVIEHAVVMTAQRTIRAEHLPYAITRGDGGSRAVTIPGSTLAEIERETILKSLAAVGGSTAQAAAMLAISPRKIQYRLREYGAQASLRGEDAEASNAKRRVRPKPGPGFASRSR